MKPSGEDNDTERTVAEHHVVQGARQDARDTLVRMARNPQAMDKRRNAGGDGRKDIFWRGCPLNVCGY